MRRRVRRGAGLGGLTVAVAIEGLGELVERDGMLLSEPVHVDALGKAVRIEVDAEESDVSDALVACVGSFLGLAPDVLDEASEAVFAYYEDTVAAGGAGDAVPEVAGAHEVWEHVTWPDEVFVQESDGSWWVSAECECTWEPEHGLLVVLRDGSRITRVGPYDGHLTNSSALGDPAVSDDEVYRRIR